MIAKVVVILRSNLAIRMQRHMFLASLGLLFPLKLIGGKTRWQVW